MRYTILVLDEKTLMGAIIARYGNLDDAQKAKTKVEQQIELTQSSLKAYVEFVKNDIANNEKKRLEIQSQINSLLPPEAINESHGAWLLDIEKKRLLFSLQMQRSFTFNRMKPLSVKQEKILKTKYIVEVHLSNDRDKQGNELPLVPIDSWVNEMKHYFIDLNTIQQDED